MILRDAVDGDAEALAALINPWITGSTITFNATPKTPQDIVAMIADKAKAGQAVIVAEGDDGLLGYATYGQFRGGVGYARSMEHSIALAPGARGRGVGRALLAAIEDHARAGGAHCIFAGVSAENPEGEAFHAAAGYARVAVLREVGFKFGRWLDLVLMQKFLS